MNVSYDPRDVRVEVLDREGNVFLEKRPSVKATNAPSAAEPPKA